MTDPQLGILVGAILTAGGTIGAAFKWGVGRIVKSTDESTAALVANTSSNAVLIVKIDNLSSKIDHIGDFVAEERSGVHDSYDVQREQRAQRGRAKTPVRGTRGQYGPGRPKTDTDSDI